MSTDTIIQNSNMELWRPRSIGAGSGNVHEDWVGREVWGGK